MSTTPFREPRVAPEDARRIFRRALDLADVDVAPHDPGPSLTHNEIERLAIELGIPEAAIKQAIHDAGLNMQGLDGGPLAPIRDNIGPGKTKAILDGELPITTLHRIMSDVAYLMNEFTPVRTLGNRIEWAPTPAISGSVSDTLISIRSSHGKTIIQIQRILWVALVQRSAVAVVSAFLISLCAGMVIAQATGSAMAYVLFCLGLTGLVALVSFVISVWILLSRRIEVGKMTKLLTQAARDAIRAEPAKPRRPRVVVDQEFIEGEGAASAALEAEKEASDEALAEPPRQQAELPRARI